MIISRTPYRISFLGGGTDYPAWYHEHGGSVLSTTIDKYCYLTCRYLPPFFEHKYAIVYSIIENVNSIDEIKHPSVRAILKHMKMDRGVAIHHEGDLPARSGMGSSSSFTVGLLHALHALKGEMYSKPDLALEGIHIEQEILKGTVGSQDQVGAAYGGLNHIIFNQDGHISCRPVTIAPERREELESHLMMFYTGIKRTSEVVAKSFTDDMEKRRRQLRIMKDLVDEGLAILSNGKPITAFGKLLDEAWQVKSSLSDKVSNPQVDELYKAAREAGAIGGKLTGAGGGGFLMLFVTPDKQPNVRRALSKLLYVPIKFEYSGSQIIFYDTERDYLDAEQRRDDGPVRKFKELSAEDENKTWPT